MSLIFEDWLKKDLDILISAPPQVLVDFCRMSLEFLRNGRNTKRYNIAAQKMKTTPSKIEDAVCGVVNLLIEACKHSLSDSDFHETVAALGFSEEQQEVLVKLYNAKHNDIRKTVALFTVDTPKYWDLEWRFENQVASRSGRVQPTPVVVMDLMLHNEPVPSFEQLKISMDEPENPKAEGSSGGLDEDRNEDDVNKDKFVKHVFLQSDIPNLVNLTGALEMALRESKSYHVTRAQNALKKSSIS